MNTYTVPVPFVVTDGTSAPPENVPVNTSSEAPEATADTTTTSDSAARSPTRRFMTSTLRQRHHGSRGSYLADSVATASIRRLVSSAEQGCSGQRSQWTRIWP